MALLSTYCFTDIVELPAEGGVLEKAHQLPEAPELTLCTPVHGLTETEVPGVAKKLVELYGHPRARWHLAALGRTSLWHYVHVDRHHFTVRAVPLPTDDANREAALVAVDAALDKFPAASDLELVLINRAQTVLRARVFLQVIHSLIR